MGMTVVIILVIAVAAGFYVMKKKSRGRSKPQKPEFRPAKAPERRSPEEEYTDIMGMLLKLNIMMRTDHSFSTELQEDIENIIDDLTAVIPP